MTVWLNGSLTSDPTLPALNAGSMLGWGVFTTFGVADGRPQFLKRHFERLRRDTALAGLELSWEWDALSAGTQSLLADQLISDGLGRITVLAAGDGFWSTAQGSHTLITVRKRAALTLDARLTISNWHPSPGGPLIGVKTTSYLPYLRAWSEAKAAGFDDALLLNTEGHLCESSRASLFWRTGSTLLTPSLSTGCLRGIGREVLSECAAQAGFQVVEGRFNLTTLHSAEEVILVSAATGPRSVTEVQAGEELWPFQRSEQFSYLLRLWTELADSEM